MEVNVVTAPVKNAPVIYATTNRTQAWITIFNTDCENTLNAQGNCYACNKSGKVRRDWTEKTQAQSNYNRGQRREFSCYNCDKRGHMVRDCRGPRKNKGCENPMDKEKMMKIFQEMMVKCNSKPEDFQ